MKMVLIFAVVMIVLLGACSSSTEHEKELLRKQAELAKKEAELAKKELELSKADNSNTVQPAKSPEASKAVVPRRVKTPAGLNAFAESSADEVLAVDLNGDGKDEYIGIVGLCGSGGCDLGVFEKTSAGFKNLFGVDDMMFPDPAPPPVKDWKPDYRFIAGPASSNGYLDIILTWKNAKPQRFRFDGNTYSR
jgi:hypothetical protein